ncbi:MAG TPA: hypothetical protein VFK38_09265 [Candidatus Limnocylindrales bacterium]|nr:hypothetical protein [Candidatus Limnocylindrales bacterium]
MALLTRGQPGAVRAVAEAIRSGRPPQALLLVGPAHVGKTTLALDLAAGLLCQAASPDERPCWACAACRRVAHGNHPDLHRIAPEGAGGQIRIGQVQALASELVLLPLEGPLRVAIVVEAHRLNPDAQNAFLKTLEEPPPGTCLVLCVEDESAMLPTVRSRAARLRLGPLPTGVLVDLLSERGVADAARAAALARAAGGRPGLALALATQPEAGLVEARLLRRLLDLAAADRRTRLGAATELLLDALALSRAERSGAERLEADAGTASPAPAAPEESPSVSDVEDATSGRSVRGLSPADRRLAAARLIEIWRGLGRDLLVAARGGQGRVRRTELLDELAVTAEGLSLQALVTFLQRLDALEAALESYANPELLVDSLLLAWPRPRQAA